MNRLLLLCGLAAFGLAAAPASAQLKPGCPDVPPDLDRYGRQLPTGLTAAQAIEPLRTQMWEGSYPYYALALARAEADPGLLPALREIAELYVCSDLLPVMLAIEASGAPSAYFLDFLDRHRANVLGIPRSVIVTLAVRGDSLVEDRLLEIASEGAADGRWDPDAENVLGSISRYRGILDAQRRLAAMSLEKRVREAIVWSAEVTFSPVLFREEYDPSEVLAAVGHETPYTASFRRVLSALGAEHPEVVAQEMPRALDSLIAKVQSPPQDADILEELTGQVWEPPSAEVVALFQVAAEAEVERVAFEGNPPAPFIPGPGETGSGVPQCDGRAATVYVAADGTIAGGPDSGQPYAGLLRGTPGPDVIVGTDGADVLRGSAGDDLLCGLAGDDELRGDNGHDALYGGPGDDTLLLGAGDDRAWGGPGDDVFRGAAGDDRAWGETGNDRLLGNGGRDTLHGGDGDDRIEGGGGNDTLRGEAGQDDARGGGGTDACDAETEASCETDPD